MLVLVVALVVYLLMRGGPFVGSTTGAGLQPFGIAGIAALTGMFSNQASDKLREFIDTLFRTVAGDDLRVQTFPCVEGTSRPTKFCRPSNFYKICRTIGQHGRRHFRRTCNNAATGWPDIETTERGRAIELRNVVR